jgi:cytochrome c
MNKIYLILVLAFLASCSNKKEKENFGKQEEIPQVATLEKGEALFQENNCTACHKIDQKVVGPSLQDVAKIYKEKSGSLVSFLKEEASPIVDPKMYESMRINLQITKTMTDEELQSLELYILSHSK